MTLAGLSLHGPGVAGQPQSEAAFILVTGTTYCCCTAEPPENSQSGDTGDTYTSHLDIVTQGVRTMSVFIILNSHTSGEKFGHTSFFFIS